MLRPSVPVPREDGCGGGLLTLQLFGEGLQPVRQEVKDGSRSYFDTPGLLPWPVGRFPADGLVPFPPGPLSVCVQDGVAIYLLQLQNAERPFRITSIPCRQLGQILGGASHAGLEHSDSVFSTLRLM